MALNAKQRFYVYVLRDPRDGAIFYVGKGNHSSGVLTREEHARMLLGRVKPFDVWIQETRPTEEYKALYRLVVRELMKIANGSLRSLPPGVDFTSGRLPPEVLGGS